MIFKYELCLAIKDEDDLPSGHKQIKQGDIVCIKPYPYPWGYVEAKRRLFVIIETTTPLPRLDSILTAKSFDGHKRQYQISFNDLKNKIPGLNISKAADPNLAYQPFKKKSHLVASTRLNSNQIIASCPGVNDNAEVCIDLESDIILFDKDAERKKKPSQTKPKTILEL